jgi:MFS family permease
MLIGAALIIGFVFYSFRPEHPLVDLRLFRNRGLTIASLTMFVFIIAFMGAGLLFPSYFLQIRGETTLAAGLLMAPQGIGAMVTMPIAGILADRIGPGKIVLTGIVVITFGMGMFTQVGVDTSYAFLLASLFVMGLGMGATMMPIMSAALATLSHESTARGSTLLNITQQVAASIGTALFSVLLTNGFKSVRATTPDGLRDGMAGSFADVFIVATVLVACCLIPAFFLPRHKILTAGGQPADAPLLVGH